MYTFIPRSLCALKRVAGKAEHARYGATTGIHLTVKRGVWQASATDGRRGIIAQGVEPLREPPAEDIPWPGYTGTPDDAFEVVIAPADLERACKGADAAVKNFPVLSRVAEIGVATMGADVAMGLGNDVISSRAVEGRFPNIMQVIPKTKPIITLRINPRILADTLLAIADLLPDGDEAVQLFFYGKDMPFGICGHNREAGIVVDGIVVPLIAPAKAKAEPTAAKPAGQPEPSHNGKPTGPVPTMPVKPTDKAEPKKDKGKKEAA